MLSDQEYQELKEDLFLDDVTMKASVFQNIIKYPTQDERVVVLIREFLHDVTPCVISIPYFFGEIRYLAIQALQKELKAFGKQENVIIRVPKPLTTEELARLKERHGVHVKGGLEGAFEGYKVLSDKGLLPGSVQNLSHISWWLSIGMWS